MTTNDHNQFNIWLDAYVAGRSTPASPGASTSEHSDVHDAVGKFHGLARQAEQTIGRNPSVATLPTNWKDFMSTHTIHTGPELASPPTRLTVPDPRSHCGSPWHVALNVALAALLILTIGTGIWRATDGFNGLNGGNPAGSDQQSAFAPETREWTPAPSDATPDQGEGLLLLPTAEECTVEPLTIDEVLWYVEDPVGASRSREMEQSATPDSNVESDRPAPSGTPDGLIANGEAVVSTPGSGQSPTHMDPLVASPPAAFIPGPASPEQLAAIAGVQRMWMACALADSPLQRWALESPELVAEQVQMLLPNFTSREEARAILEEVETTGKLEPSDDFWKQPNASYAMITSQGFPALNTVALVDPVTVPSWTIDGRTFQVGYISYDMEDGNARGSSVMPATETAPVSTAAAEPDFNICNHFELTWFPDRDDLLVSGYPKCG